MSEGKKLDAGKEPLDLLPYEALKEIAKVLDFGAKKYSRGNWTGGIAYSRLIAATLRHVNQFNSGEDNDAETGLSHLAHAGCEVLFLLWMIQKRSDLDDRCFKQTKPVPETAELPKCGALTLQLGKRYKNRRGEITAALILNPQPIVRNQYPFYDALSANSYTLEGLFERGKITGYDLVEEAGQ